MGSAFRQTVGMGDSERLYNVWVTAEPASDLPGQWVVHCLDFDVVSQGDSLQHAMTMIEEASSMVVVDDLSKHHDPHDRRASDTDYDVLWNVVANGDRISEAEAFADRSGKYIYVFPMELRVKVPVAGGAKPSIASARRRLPVAFAQKRTAS